MINAKIKTIYLKSCPGCNHGAEICIDRESKISVVCMHCGLLLEERDSDFERAKILAERWNKRS
jgi:Zn ribbon nucleic-acid-binding protein